MHIEIRTRGTRRYAALSAAAGVLLVLVLGLLVLWQEKFTFVDSPRWLLANRVLLPFSLACVALFAALRRPCARLAPPWGAARWRVTLYWIVLLALQLTVTHAVWAHAGGEMGAVCDAAGQLARGLTVDGDFFRLYPGSAPLAMLLTLPLWMAQSLGLAAPYAVLPCLSAVLCNLACQVALACVRRLTRSRFAHLGTLALCTVWLALNAALAAPSAEGFALLFPVLAFYVWLAVKGPFAKWGLISLLCFLGASVKPAVLLVEIALVAVSALGAFPLRRLGAAGGRRVAIGLIALLLGAVPGRVWQDGATAYLAGSAAPQERLGIPHSLMVGMNGSTYGEPSPEDTAYSASFATWTARRQADLQRAGERLRSRNMPETLYFFAVKTVKAFGDGTLASGRDERAAQAPAQDDPLSLFLLRAYARQGDLRPLAVTVAQTAWLGLLALCAVALLTRTRRKPAVAALGLTLCGAYLSALLLEAGPQNLLLYAPLLVVLAAQGLTGLRMPQRTPRA